MRIFAQGRNRTLEWNRESVHHVPRVGVVAVKTTELAPSGPRHETNTWTINRRTRSERMQEADVTRLQRLLDDRLGDVLTQARPQLKRVRCFQWSIFRRLQLIHHKLPVER